MAIKHITGVRRLPEVECKLLVREQRVTHNGETVVRINENAGDLEWIRTTLTPTVAEVEAADKKKKSSL